MLLATCGVKAGYSSERTSEKFSKMGRCRISVRIAKVFLQAFDVKV